MVWREIPPSNILIEVARRVTRVTLTSSMTSSRVTRDDSEEMTCGASMTRDDGNCRPGGPGPLYLVQVRPCREKYVVIAGAATARVGLKYLIQELAPKSPACG